MMNSVSNQTFQLSIVDFIPEAAENQSPLLFFIFILNLVFSSLIIVFSNFISRNIFLILINLLTYLDLGLIYLHFSVLFSVLYLQKMIKQNAQKAADSKKASAVAEEEDDEDEDEVRHISILLIQKSQYLVNPDYLNTSLFDLIFSHLLSLLVSRRIDLLDIRTVTDCMTWQLISIYLQY